MRAKAVDVGESVFKNETEAMLYVIKDTYAAEDAFIFSLPVIKFAWVIKTENDFEPLRTLNILGSMERTDKLIAEMKKVMEEFE